jgi:hypothetical protein
MNIQIIPDPFLIDETFIENFIKFGEKMELPQTALVALQGPIPIPFFDGSCWYPAFDMSTGQGTTYSYARMVI